ncbi:MAG: hypothetical protein PF795_04330, partial [Kiritimatiellae bacterium]|nr:hypothetical protein [Kiritimatiellia bacterium]
MKIKLYTTLLTLAVISTFTQAATITWTGLAGDGNFESAGNWTGDRTPPAVDDFQDIATFTSATTPSTITLGSGRDIGGLRFETAGWT